MARSSDIDVRLRLRDARRFQADAKRSKQSVEGFAGSVRRAGRGMQDIGARTSSFGKNLTRSVTLPILGAGVAAFKMHADFEDSMSKITGLVGISEKQVGSWSNDILGMAKDLPQSPKELADAMFFITSAGLRGKTALDALNASARASAGGLGETKSVADAVTSAMNAYGKDVLSAGRATDILTGAVRAGKLEASELAPVIGSVLPMAQAAGVGFEEVAGSIALMSKAGTNAARGATQVTAILSTFANGAPKTTAALDEMGMSLDGVRKMLANKGLATTLDTLRKRAKDAGIDLSQVFSNKRALTGVLQMTKSMKETNSVMDGVRKSHGMTDKAFAAASKTAKFQMAAAWSSVQVTLIRLGEALGPVLVPIIKKVGKFVGELGDKFSNLSKPAKTVLLIVALVAAALGPLLVVIGTLIGAIGTIAVAFAAISLPVVAVIVGIAALGVALVLLWKRSETFRDIVTGAWEAVKSAAKTAIDWLVTELPKALKSVVTGTRGIQAAARWLTTAFLNVVKFLMPVWTFLGRFLIDAIKKAWAGVKNVFEGAFKVITGIVQFFDAVFRGDFRGMWNAVKRIFSGGLQILKGLLGAGTAVLRAIVSRLGKGIVALLGLAWKLIKLAAVAAFNHVKGKLTDIVDFVRGLPGKITSAAKGMWEGVKSGFKAALNWVIGKWNDLVSSLGGGFIGKVAGKVGVDIDSAKIPELAMGGLVQGFGSFITGDRGPELNTITPQGVVVQPLAAAMAGGGGATAPAPAPEPRVDHVHKIYLDGHEIAQAMGRAVRDRKGRQ